MFCGGTRVVNVRVSCYSRVRVLTLHSGPSYALGGVQFIMTDELRGEKLFEGSYCWPR